jgi:hypothetical protein
VVGSSGGPGDEAPAGVIAAGGPDGKPSGLAAPAGATTLGEGDPMGGSDDPSGGSTDSRSGSAPGDGPAGGASWGPLTSALSALGIPGPAFGGFALAPTLVTTTGAATMALAFGLFGKRRRDGEPPAPDGELAAAAAAGLGIGTVIPTLEDEVEAAEALLPRWRRPSLLQARKADPIRDATPGTAARLTFDHGLVGPLDGHERRVIRYRVVRMLDTPDELRGTETGFLDRGDEVQLLEKYGAYWLVLCPDGRRGWVHNMTLGEIVDEEVQADRPVATMPLAAETWTMGESDADADVLEAYLESRRRMD